jgi:copper chaperone CopZ
MTTTYLVNGMSCQHCVNAVTGELTGLAGVSAVTVDLVPDGTSLLTVTSDGPLDEDAVRAAVEEAGGYQLTSS